MTTQKTQLQARIQFWHLIAPLFASLVLYVQLLNAPGANWIIPLVFITALPLCFFWRIKGLIFSSIALACAAALLYPDIPAQDRFWEVGMSFSLILTLVIFTLAFEEAGHQVEEVRRESKSRLDTLLRLDEKLKSVQEEAKKSGMRLAHEVEDKEKEAEEALQQLKSNEELLEAARLEIEHYSQKQEALLQDLFEMRKEAEDLQVDKDVRHWEGKYKQLRGQFEEKNEVLDQTRKELFHAKEALFKAEIDYKEQLKFERSQELKALEVQLMRSTKRIKELEQEITSLEEVVTSTLESS